MSKTNCSDFVFPFFDPFCEENSKEKAIFELERAFKENEISLAELFEDLLYWSGTFFVNVLDDCDDFLKKSRKMIEKYVSCNDFIDAVIQTQSFIFISYILYNRYNRFQYLNSDEEIPGLSLEETKIPFEKRTIKLKNALDEMISQLVQKGNTNDFLSFAEKNLRSFESYLLCDEYIYNLLKRLIDFIISMGDANVMCKYASYNLLLDKYPYLFNALLETHDLKNIYRFMQQFPKKDNYGFDYFLSNESMNLFITDVIKTNIPAYMYLVVVKVNNIPDEEMKRLITAIIASDDKQYIDYLLLTLYKKGISKELRSFITSLNISIDAATRFNYDDNFADELEHALLEDDYEILYKHGMYTYEDRAYVLANIQAGL